MAEIPAPTGPAIGIDLGGTRIKAALVDRADGRLLQQAMRHTEDGAWVGKLPRFVSHVADLIAELETAAGHQALPVGLAAPGLASPKGRSITWMPGRMDGLEGLDWTDRLGRPVRVLNDAQAALLAEVAFGAARGCRDVLLLTLGTGVGGAVWSGGRLLTGANGRGGHLGHISLDWQAPRDVFQTPGSLEALLGNQSLASRSKGRFASTLDLLAAMRAGEASARTLWQDSVRALAVALASLINVLDPERILLGGGITKAAGSDLLEPLQNELKRCEWRIGDQAVQVLPASAGEWAGAQGAAWQA
jgi:glucokinase